MDQSLKSSLGDPGWLRFFQLMSSELARKENEPLVPGTPSSLSEARDELMHLIGKYNPVQRLENYSEALNFIEHADKDDHFFILNLKPKSNMLVISSFRKNQSQLASEKYLAIESGIEKGSEEEAVLVSVDSVASLRRAYPNYFLDTKAFASQVTRIERLARRG